MVFALSKIKERYNYSIILIRELVITDFKLRYQGSFLGYLWSLLRPLALFVILYIVFVKFLPVGKSIPHYPIYLLVGIVLWNFFTELTTGSIAAIAGKGDLIRKINFPKYVIVLAGSFSALVNLGFNMIVVVVFMAIFGTDITLDKLWIVPISLIQIYALGLGLAFMLSALFVKFRDIAYVWEVVMQAAFYATPILYPLSVIPEKAQKLLILSPVAQPLQAIRDALVTPKTMTISEIYTNMFMIILPMVLTIVIVVSGGLYFRNRSKYFAEEV